MVACMEGMCPQVQGCSISVSTDLLPVTGSGSGPHIPLCKTEVFTGIYRNPLGGEYTGFVAKCHIGGSKAVARKLTSLFSKQAIEAIAGQYAEIIAGDTNFSMMSEAKAGFSWSGSCAITGNGAGVGTEKGW